MLVGGFVQRRAFCALAPGLALQAGIMLRSAPNAQSAAAHFPLSRYSFEKSMFGGVPLAVLFNTVSMGVVSSKKPQFCR